MVLPASVVIVSAAAVKLARAVALKRALLDHPNERSSHRQPLPRLGGAAFIPVVLVAVGIGWFGTGLPGMVSLAFFGGWAALFAISLLDDFRSLPTTVRFAVQFAVAGGFVAVVGSSWNSAAGDAVSGFGLRLQYEGALYRVAGAIVGMVASPLNSDGSDAVLGSEFRVSRFH